MSVPQPTNANLRDLVERFVPPWLADNYPDKPSWGFRFLWTLVLIVDSVLELLGQASLGAVGHGDPTANAIVGAARGMIRNQDESEEDWGKRLATWVDRAKENGSSYRLAYAIHDYLRSHPRVRVFRRDGYCVTVDTDRSLTINEVTAWDWDSVSHPYRNDPGDSRYCNSDLFVVVYTTSGTITQWAVRPGTLGDMTGGDDGFALGHLATWKERDDLKAFCLMCKAANECIRALIWCSDESKFVPSNPASMPNGKWGAWGIASGTSYIPSDRDLTTCRFWEPR